MKALQIMKYEIKESLSINEIEKPLLKPKDILVEVKAAC
jgi:NADPH:quinone reductase-like Zn-dependent oxidoreductase